MNIDAHIGLLDSPDFDFYGGNYNGNIPDRLSPFLKDARKLMDIIGDMVTRGEENARQLDWGAVGVIYTKQQLRDFFGKFYPGGGSKELRKFLRELDPEKKYVLTAYEAGGDYGDD